MSVKPRAKKLKLLSEKFIYFINTHPISFLCMLVAATLLITHGRFIFAIDYFVYSDIGGDTMGSYLPTYNMFVQKIATGNFSLWEFSRGLGVNVLGTLISDPFAWPLFIVGVVFGTGTINYMLIVTYILRIFCAAILCYLYLSEFKFSRPAKVAGAYLYGFNGFLMLWGQHYHFGTASVLLILVLLCIEKCLKNSRSLLILAVSVFVLMIFSAHYFGYKILLFAGLYAVFRVVQTTKLKECITGAKKLILLGIGVLVGTCMSAVLAIPSILHLFISDRIQQGNAINRIINTLFAARSPESYETTILRLFSNNLQGVGNNYHGSGNYFEPIQVFFSSFIFVLCVYFAANYIYSKKGLKANALMMVAFLFFVHYVVFLALPLIFNGLVQPSHRSSFIIAPAFAFVVAASCDALVSDRKIGLKSLFIYAGIVLGAGVFIYVLTTDTHDVSRRYAVLLLILYICSAAVLALYSYVKKPSTKHWLLITLGVIIFVNVSAEGYISANERRIGSQSHPQIRIPHLNDGTRDAINALREYDTSLHRMEKTYTDHSWLGLNENQRQRYNSISFYGGTRNRYTDAFFVNIWPERMASGNPAYVFATDAHRQADLSALLNLKYFLSRGGDGIADMAEFKLVMTVGNVDIYRNTKAGGFGILFDRSADMQSFMALDLESRRDVLRHYVVLNDAVWDTPTVDFESLPETWNGFAENSVEVWRIGNDGRLQAHVAAPQNSYLFFPIPYQDGWRVYVNGEEADILRANLGFMAVPISEGEHFIELRYRSPGIVLGGALSVLGLFMFLLLVYFTRKRKQD